MIWLGKNVFPPIVSTTFKSKKDIKTEDLVNFLN